MKPSPAAEPGNGPFDRPVAAGLGDLAGEDVVGDAIIAFDCVGKVVLEAAGKVQSGFRRCLIVVTDQCGITLPADLDTAKQIGF